MLPPADRCAIEAVHEAWLDAERRGDWSAVLRLCVETPVWLPPNEAPLCGRAAILHWLEKQPAVAVQKIDIDHLFISGADSLACKVATFRTMVEGTAAGVSQAIIGSHCWLLQRGQSGLWRVAVVSWTLTDTGLP